MQLLGLLSRSLSLSLAPILPRFFVPRSAALSLVAVAYMLRTLGLTAQHARP